MILLRLFWEFFKTGLFAVGGGLATLPFLYDISTRTGWFSQAQLADMIAVSESTPGPIGVNMATYVGFTTGGIPGLAALKSLFDWKAVALATVLLIATRGVKPLKKLHPIVFIAASAAVGILFSF